MQQGSHEQFVGREKRRGRKWNKEGVEGGQRLVHGDKSGQRERQRERKRKRQKDRRWVRPTFYKAT